MGRKKQVKCLDVYLNSAQVGRLKKETTGLISFRYVGDWIDNGFPISNSFPIQEDEFRGEIVSRYFDNLLPDNDEIRKAVATKFGAESIRPFDMLNVIGKDCVGALSFLSEDSDVPPGYQLQYTQLNEAEIARQIRGLSSSNPLGMGESDFRLSIAGAQEKTALLNIDGKWCLPQGLTPTTHIFKTSIGALGIDVDFSDSIDNEWASLLIMRKMGLDVCSAKIEQFEDQRVLVVERFDRKWKEYQGQNILLRLPQEDLCQALGVSPYQKYQSEGGPGVESISKFLLASRKSEDRINFFKALMVFDLLYATDGHAKNFSISMAPNGYHLTPFYDVMSGYFLHAREKNPLKKLKLAMKIGHSGHYAFSRITKRHYAESAKLCGLNQENFEKICAELSEAYGLLAISDSELDPQLNKETLVTILEGMKQRAKIVL